ncbi:hypothetical protein NQZ68_020863, partial [Dissostichus eleginoides]
MRQVSRNQAERERNSADCSFKIKLGGHQSESPLWSSCQVCNMASWIIHVTMMVLSVFISSSQGKRDQQLYCS